MITHSGSEEKNCFKYRNEDFIKKNNEDGKNDARKMTAKKTKGRQKH